MNKFLRILSQSFLYAISVIALLAITGYIYLYVLPKGPEVTEPSPIEIGEDSFVMYAYKDSKRKSLKVWTYKPHSWQNGDRIIFVMHGGGRNADDYLAAWTDLAEQQNLLVIAPEFANKFSKYTTNDYQEGNLFTFFGTKNPEEEWAYTVIENIFDHIKSVDGITNKSYDIFGHSAGGQFVHRMVLLKPEARIGTAIAANSGFYSLPDTNLSFPYGMKNTVTDPVANLKEAYSKRLIILLGELDNDPSLGVFRKTENAMQQGSHRLERGTNFYAANLQLSEAKEWSYRWKIDTVTQVGHNYRKMSEAAIEWIK
ncbi:hypothetical protein, partial [Fulvivirga aurantia]|uniref:hypothetical protein n=1 Tax=Fulvivirga aurantia TaxID=2529383 RepID=UPI0016251AA2